MANPTSRGIFVLGMHRSGTSCLTGMLESSGAFVGEVARKNRQFNPKGNLENVDARKLNGEVLRENGGDWQAPPAAIVVSPERRAQMAEQLAVYADQACWVLKDPRMVLMLDAWLAAASTDIALVGTFRHPMAVARSLFARNELPIEAGLATWERYNRDLVREHQQRGFPLVSFDRLGEDYIRQYQRLCQWLDLPFREAAARDFYAREFVKQAVDDAEVPAAQRATFDYLRAHALDA